MTLQQLRYFLETVRHGYNVTAAASALGTSQPAASKQIRLLEEELGLLLFVRSGKQFVEITEAGKRILELGEKMLAAGDTIRHIAQEYTDDSVGTLRIATTHGQARYVLPNIIKAFLAKYPKVSMQIKQGTPRQINLLAMSREVDLTLVTENSELSDNLTILPCYQWNRSVLVKKDHPLVGQQPLSLEAVAQYPIITYVVGLTGRSQIDIAFEKLNVVPNIVFTAADADVIKTYVKIGLGIGIVASMAYDEKTDGDLVALDARHLFAPSTTLIGFHHDAYLRGYMYEFIQLLAPHLTPQLLDEAISVRRGNGVAERIRDLALPWH